MTVEAYLDTDALDRDLILPRLVGRRTEEQPDRPFATMVDGPSLSYGETHHEALRWAAALRNVGVTRDQTVATMMPIGLDAVTSWLGISWLCAWEVPVNADYRGRMLTHLMTNAQVQTAIVGYRYLDRFAEITGSIPDLKRIIVTGPDGPIPVLDGVEMLPADDLLAHSATDEELEGPEPWDISAIIYTSGTTGPSKGVMMPWAQMLANFNNPLWEVFGPEDHRYSPFPMYHIGGKGSTYGAALDGAQVVLKERWSASEFWDDIARYKCTFTWLVGAMPTLLHAAPERPEDAETPLKYALMAPVLPEYRDFERRFGVKLCTVYNMSEMSMPVITGWDLANHQTCGRARAGYEIRLVDEHGIPVPPGKFGEFVVRSSTPWTMNVGYLGMPDKTAEAWRHGWFHTGDGGTYDEDGNLYFVDRIKHAIRRRGENISSMEVEVEVLAHDSVAECAVVGVPSPLGEEDVMAFVVPATGVEFDPAALVEFLEPRLPKFMVPRYVQVVEELPKTATLRVRKVELRSLVDIGGATWDRDAGEGIRQSPRAQVSA